METPDAASVASRLKQATFTGLFERLDHKTLDDIWDNGRARGALEELVADASADPQSRFLAAEILFARLPGYPPRQATGDLAGIYAAALRAVPEHGANAWGLPGRVDGQLGRHVFALGAVAIPQLRGLLNDARAVGYEGSQDATLGNSFHFRVKDISASLIARIRGLPFAPEKDPAARDNAIRELTSNLGKEQR